MGGEGRARAQTVSRRHLLPIVRADRDAVSVDELAAAAEERPRTRAECRDGPRPCAFISCRFHLYLDVNPATGSIKFNFPDREPWEMTESCALDVADRGGATLDVVGAALNVVRERIRQEERRLLQKAHALGFYEDDSWRDLARDGLSPDRDAIDARCAP